MPNQIITTATTATVIADTADLIYVADTGSVISATSNAIRVRTTTSFGVDVAVDGDVVSLVTTAILLNGTSNGSGPNTVSIGQDGLVRSVNGVAIEIRGSGSSVTNHGEVHAVVYGVYNSLGNSVDLDNTGVISSNYGVVSQGNSSELHNSGTILAEVDAVWLTGTGGLVDNTGRLIGDRGILVQGGDARIVNTGAILAANTGVEAFGDGTRVHNFGQIEATGSWGIRFRLDDAGTQTLVTNSGQIEAGATGVQFDSSFLGSGAGQRLVNTGAIIAISNAVQSETLSFTVVNHGSLVSSGAAAIAGGGNVTVVNHGIIEGGLQGNGGSIAISLGAGTDVIRNFGTIAGSLLTGEGADVVRNGGQIEREINLGAGSDLYLGQRATAEETVYGGDQRDVILAGGGDDLLFGDRGDDDVRGGGGDDTIHGGAGFDELRGGAGADLFIFGSAGDISSGRNRDVIHDFRSGQDVIDLGAFMRNGSFIGAAAFGSEARQVRYVAANGRIEGDVNGDGTADWVLQLANRPAVLSEADFAF